MASFGVWPRRAACVPSVRHPWSAPARNRGGAARPSGDQAVLWRPIGAAQPVRDFPNLSSNLFVASVSKSILPRTTIDSPRIAGKSRDFRSVHEVGYTCLGTGEVSQSRVTREVLWTLLRAPAREYSSAVRSKIIGRKISRCAGCGTGRSTAALIRSWRPSDEPFCPVAHLCPPAPTIGALMAGWARSLRYYGADINHIR